MSRRRRHYAPRSRDNCEIGKKRQARLERKELREWIEQQRVKRASWTDFKFPVDRIAFCYNLKPSVFEDIKNTYLSGNFPDRSDSPEGNEPIRPRNRATIRQDIFACILCLKYELSKSDFVAIKRLATCRNTNRGVALSQEEHKKWPARPDVFVHCPQPDLNGVSDDEVLDFYLSKDFIDDEDNSRIDNSDDEHDSAAYLTDEDEYRPLTEHITEPPANRACAVPGVENSRVSLLRHLCETYGAWGSVEDTMNLYCIGRSKAFEVRKAVTDLHRGLVEGVTWLDFENTFEDDSLMRTGLQRDKFETIQHVVLLHKTSQTSESQGL